ncbi:UNKNOWN [Stylonychia lemnae]|uniref:FERM domain-containing protein n=1 Tax=Stylonychia lemnae TaxID=5949 RepID=A0A078AVV6_STYLE|nr:UNKNOWN [Stylonychia lemnae]|eukprot:CDW86570.1 UNKNOWN [Stylonychia lemnae]
MDSLNNTRNNAMRDIPISTKVQDDEMDAIDVCSCGNGQKAVYYCFDPKPDCEIGQIYFCDQCKINHLSHASILLTDFKKKYINEINKSFHLIDVTFSNAQAKMDMYSNFLSQCQRGKSILEPAEKRRDPLEDIKKLEQIYEQTKRLRDYGESFFQKNKVSDLNKINMKFRDFVKIVQDFEYISEMNDQIIWDCYQPAFESDFEFDLSSLNTEEKELYYKFKIQALSSRVKKLEVMLKEHNSVKQCIAAIAVQLNIEDRIKGFGL